MVSDAGVGDLHQLWTAVWDPHDHSRLLTAGGSNIQVCSFLCSSSTFTESLTCITNKAGQAPPSTFSCWLEGSTTSQSFGQRSNLARDDLPSTGWLLLSELNAIVSAVQGIREEQVEGGACPACWCDTDSLFPCISDLFPCSWAVKKVRPGQHDQT